MNGLGDTEPCGDSGDGGPAKPGVCGGMLVMIGGVARKAGKPVRCTLPALRPWASLWPGRGEREMLETGGGPDWYGVVGVCGLKMLVLATPGTKGRELALIETVPPGTPPPGTI